MKKLSAEDLARYKLDGVVHLKGAFGKEWLSKEPSTFEVPAFRIPHQQNFLSYRIESDGNI